MDAVPEFSVWDANNSGSGYTQLCYLKPIALRRCAGPGAELLECEVVLDSNAALPVSPSQRALRLRAHEWRSLPIGGGQTLKIGHRVTFRVDMGAGDKLWFVGDLTNAVVGFDGGESLRLVFTSIKARLDDRTVHGQVVEAANEQVTFLSGLPCVFNPGGVDNRRAATTSHHPFEPSCGQYYSCFQVAGPAAVPWKAAEMIEYILNAFVTDADIEKPTASGLAMIGLDVPVDDVEIEGMTPSAAIDSILSKIGFRWALVAEESAFDPNDYWYALKAFKAGAGTARSLRLAAPGSAFDAQTTNLAAGGFNFDAGAIINELDALGGVVEVEALFSTKGVDVEAGAVRLYRGWLRAAERQYDSPTMPTKPKDRYFIPYIKGHKDNTKWDAGGAPTRDVGRRFVVNETGCYADSGGENSPPYPHPSEPGDLRGLLGDGNFVLRRRHFLAQRIQPKGSGDDRPEEIDVEVWNEVQGKWLKYAGQVKFLPDELGILITTRDITRNAQAVEREKFHCPRKDQPILTIDPDNGDTDVADVRFRAAIEMDVKARGAFGKRQDNACTVYSPTTRTIRRTVTPGSKYRVRLVHHSSSGSRNPNPACAVKTGDSLDQTAHWSLSGVNLADDGNTGEIWEGSGSYGRLSAKLRLIGGAYTVEVCKGSGGSKVAEGSIEVPNGTVTLEEVGGSGLTGSVDIEYRQDAEDIELLVYEAVISEIRELEDYAKQKRDALEAMAVSGCPVVVWISDGYQLGDVITELHGRDMSLQANATGVEGEGRHPQVVGIVWHLDEEQTTELVLDDARQQG